MNLFLYASIILKNRMVLVAEANDGSDLKEVTDFKYLGAWMQSSEKDNNKNAIIWNLFKVARAPDARYSSVFTFYHLSKHKTVLYRFMQ